jgi:nucleoside-diphosphate-sugar epimerase
MTERILITGALGQIGTELASALRNIYGVANVITTDIKLPQTAELKSGPHEILDVTDIVKLNESVIKNNITQVYHLAAILSASGERNPIKAWQINMNGLLNILESCVTNKVKKLFWPSTIAVFGPTTPKINAPQNTITEPTTVYGISKLAGEGWCNYYFEKEGLDVRSIRYPGLISYKSKPGGGTTDYAVEIFYEALQHGRYECFLAANTRLPMMYMPDAIRGTLELMEAPSHKISVRTSYNFSAFSFSPEKIADEIKKHIPDFKILYHPDFRQQLAASWPQSIDDAIARNDWNWKPEFDLPAMTADMLRHIKVDESVG